MSRIIEIIKDYKKSTDKAVTIFKRKYGVSDILRGYWSGLYEQTGELKDDGIQFYAYHGIGLSANFNDKIVDFDFAFFPKPRHDGFDLGRITNFIENQIENYSEYKEKSKIEHDFNELIRNRIIANPELKDSTTLYFFKESLNSTI